jgi:hypothetical protein
MPLHFCERYFAFMNLLQYWADTANATAAVLHACMRVIGPESLKPVLLPTVNTVLKWYELCNISQTTCTSPLSIGCTLFA